MILRRPQILEAQYVIPIGGMILGNCLRADIIGVRSFYQAIRTGQKAYELALAQGATIMEAAGPYLRDSLYQALTPTVAMMANVGIVALPGMMTGVILGGNDPLTAIGYQIAIMLSIFTGTSITVILAILFSASQCVYYCTACSRRTFLRISNSFFVYCYIFEWKYL